MTQVDQQAKSRAERLESMIDPDEAKALQRGDHSTPHRVLGPHPAQVEEQPGVVVRAFHPDALAAECLVEEANSVRMEPLGGGLFAVFFPGRDLPLRYRLRFHFADRGTWVHDDPYRFPPTLGDVDLHLFNEGTHRRLWEILGAHPRSLEGISGTAFAVWAPAARHVSVVGDFCHWDGRLFPMRAIGSSGVFEIFIPGVEAGAFYKYEIKTQDGALRLKSDPFALAMELPPGTASRVTSSSYLWDDREWMQERPKRDLAREPVSIYEVHLGSWAHVMEEGHRSLRYRELAHRLVEHVKRFGFTHIELLPIAEHPLYASWGYQVTGYYAPTSRYGSPDDLRYLIDTCHREGIGVILDWVPAHFPKDDFALRWFDGTALYEHEDPRRGEHPDWGTLIFNYGRKEVRNFLIANALYWLHEFHIDGLRVDAVASMLYLDYSREEHEWIPNPSGGREDLDALEFLRALNTAVQEEVPGAIVIAEESTAWPGVTRPVEEGGLGFTFKWNMGWMHDTLVYFGKEPVHRKHHQDQLTFSMIYEQSELFINPLSHDEVVHGKRSLLEKMPGDVWQKFANLRTLLTYQFTRPGKKLLFMGTELAPYNEWIHSASLDWHLANDPMREGFARFLEDLGQLYRGSPPLWQRDPDPDGFSWIDCTDWEQSILCYVRRDAANHLVVLLNLTPVPREDYRIGAPEAGRYFRRFSSDDGRYGGSGFETAMIIETEPLPYHGLPQSIRVSLPPLGALVLAPAR